MFKTILLIYLFSFSLFAGHEWQLPKAALSKAHVNKLIGKIETEKFDKKINLLWVYGYDLPHKNGEHDYVYVKDTFVGLLNSVENVHADEAYGFPSKEQFAKADVLVIFTHLPDLNDEQFSDFENFVKRGGGVVTLHESVIIRPSSQGKKLSPCLGCAWNEGTSNWGAIYEPVTVNNKHKIFKGFPKKLTLNDEFYWDLYQEEATEVLATVRIGPPQRSKGPIEDDSQLSKERHSVFWTYTHGEGRVFGTTTGHHTFTYFDPEFRIILFRGIAWALNEDAGPFMPLVFEGITDKNGKVGTTDNMRHLNKKEFQRIDKEKRAAMALREK